MARLKEIGASHQKDRSDSIPVEILDTNRTIFVAPLNENAGDEPELTNCRSIQDVFKTYKPRLEGQVKNENGESEDANLEFNKITDFNVETVVAQCPTLKKQQNEKTILAEFLKAVGSNATLRRALSDPEQREQLLQGFRSTLEALGGPPEDE